MKKQIFSLVIVLTALVGCVLNRNGSFEKTIYKTKSDKIIVTGTVYDTHKNNRTLPGVAIKSADTNLLTTTNRDGKFRVDLSEGKHIIRASYIGYLMTSTRSIELVKGDSLVIDFVLKESRMETIN
ncbi:carboxypeptidase-like regulatory domain-containing protein [Pedobacter ghigonis]|uniref:carboxypeptidase-like regulatory domain-containing protein n=1 Tax=Pedobacter ghigonis TaxID=2730403 RepID=UPI00158E54E6|nr:carboxypeptidase-like regulatory domain-containing protein [Pedobacter ghigonis]